VCLTETIVEGQPTTIKLNITLQKQMIDLLENSGTKGMILSVSMCGRPSLDTIVTPRQEISSGLGNFDRRTLELLLTKMDKVPPPTHLSDLRIVQLMETHGRERRWRYFTFASYRKIIANEKLDDKDGPYSLVDFSNVGNFAPFVADDFYSDVVELNRFADYAFSKTRKEEGAGKETARKRAKAATSTTGVLGPTVSGKKRKRGEAGLDAHADGDSGHTPRKRGRPRKIVAESHDNAANAAGKGAATTSDRSRNAPEEGLGPTQPEGTIVSNDLHSPSRKVPRKRRRPPDDNYDSEVVPEAPAPSRGRGRSRKQPPSIPPIDETGHPPLQNVDNPSDAHVAPLSLSDPLPPSVNAIEAEAQSTLNESDTALQHPERSMQPELISSTIQNDHSPEDLGMGMEIMDDNQVGPAQPPGDPNTDPKQTRAEGPGELDTLEGAPVRMDTSSGLYVFVNAASGMGIQVGKFGTLRLTFVLSTAKA
jgi:hypothetical protein